MKATNMQVDHDHLRRHSSRFDHFDDTNYAYDKWHTELDIHYMANPDGAEFKNSRKKKKNKKLWPS